MCISEVVWRLVDDKKRDKLSSSGKFEYENYLVKYMSHKRHA